MMDDWLRLGLYVGAWVWICSPWFRFLVLPGLEPHRGIPLWRWPWGAP